LSFSEILELKGELGFLQCSSAKTKLFEDLLLWRRSSSAEVLVKLKKRRRRREEGRRGCWGFFSDSRIFLSSIFEEAFQAPPEEENYSKLHFQIRSLFRGILERKLHISSSTMIRNGAKMGEEEEENGPDLLACLLSELCVDDHHHASRVEEHQQKKKKPKWLLLLLQAHTYIHTLLCFAVTASSSWSGASKGTRQRTRVIEQFKKPQTIAEKDTGLLFGCCRIERKRT
jgi:hypothetical protein